MDVSDDIFKLCDALNFEPTWQQRQLLEAVQRGDRRIACRSGQGPGKCVPLDRANQFVYLPGMGLRKHISELMAFSNADKDAFFKVTAMDEATEKLALADAQALESGTKQCVDVEVDSGQSLGLSTDHPIYTPRGWVEAGDLKPGDLVAMPRRLPAPEKTLKIDDRELRIVTALLCDGGTSSEQGGNVITHLPGDFLDLFIDDCEAIGIGLTVRPFRSKAITLGLSNALEITRRWGLQGKKSVERQVPAEFYGLSDRQLGIFFNTIFACDGYTCKDGYEIVLASRPFIDDLQTLLLRFGVHSRIRYKAARYVRGGETFDAWKLTVSGADNIKALHQAMGLPVGREMQTTAMLKLTLEGKQSNTNTDIVPVQTEQWDQMLLEIGVGSARRGRKKAEGLSRTEIRKKYRGRGTSYWSRQKLEGFCEDFNYQGKYAKWASNDIYWVKVTKVTPTGEHPVVDLCVPERGNFVVNNLIVHNTTCTTVAALWRCLRHPRAMTVVTAPTMRQCTEVFMGEIRNHMKRANPLIRRFFNVTNTRVTIAGVKDWGIKLVTATKEENAQGYHDPNMTVIGEEASGIPENIITQFKGTLSNPNSMFLLIGNPNTRDCAFFDCFHSQKSSWTGLHWNAEETPESEWFSQERNRDLAREFGRDSDVYRIRVLGEFPRTDPNCVLSDEELELIFDKSLLIPAAKMLRREDMPPAKQFGLDFARYGGDENTLFRRSGNAIVQWGFFPHTDPNDLVDTAFDWQRKAGWKDADTWFVADAGGMGQGVMGNFHRANKNIVEFHSNARAVDSRKYDNRMTEAWFQFAKMVREGRCYMPRDNQMVKQLTGRRYFTTRKGKLVLESKDDYMKRGHDSPDRADGLVMAFYDSPVANGMVSNKHVSQHRVGMQVR